MKWQPNDDRIDLMITKTGEMRSSSKPHWRDVRKRLKGSGISTEDAALGEWQPEGEHAMFGLIASRNGRLFIFDATFDYDPSGEPLAKGIGWINRWRELAPEKAQPTAAGYPNTYAQAAMIALRVFESEVER